MLIQQMALLAVTGLRRSRVQTGVVWGVDTLDISSGLLGIWLSITLVPHKMK